MKRMMMILAMMILGIGVLLTPMKSVSAEAHFMHEIQDHIGTDRFAHFGVSYVINDQLQRNAKMSPFMATMTTIAIGAAKEKWVDSKWDKGDFAADCAGALFVNIKF